MIQVVGRALSQLCSKVRWVYFAIVSAIAAITAVGIYLTKRLPWHRPAEIEMKPPARPQALPPAAPPNPSPPPPLALALTPLPNLGNTCYMASMVQGWLLAQEGAIRQMPESDVRQRLIAFLDAYRAGNGDLLPLMELAYTVSLNYRNNCNAARDQFIRDIERVLSNCQKDLQRGTSSSGVDLPRLEALLLGYQGQMESLQGRSPFELYRELRACGQGTQMCFPQEDAVEIIELFGKQIYGHYAFEGVLPVSLPHQEAMVDSNTPFDQMLRTAWEDKGAGFAIPPQTLVLQMNRLRPDQRLLQGPTAEVPEVLEVPGIFFGDNEARFYHLQGVIYREGDASGGHFVALVRGNGEEWFLADDTVIRPVDVKEVLQVARFGHPVYQIIG